MATEKVTSIAKTSGTGKKKKDVRVSVREIENGFVVTKSTEWQDPKKGWQYVTKEYFSKDNPLEINLDDKSLADLF